MPLEETGKVKIISIKQKNSDVLIEYKFGNDTKKIKVFYLALENISLVENDEVEKSVIEKILSNDKEEKIRKYLINLIVKQPYSEYELEKKATLKFNDEKNVKKVISLLKKDKLIDDKEYVLTYLDYFKNNLYGKYYIFNFFKGKKISEKLIENIEISDDEEKEKALKYFEMIKNKFVSANFIRQKKRIYDAMLLRGYDISIINDVLKNLHVDEEKEKELFLKDFKKAKAKFLKVKDPSAKITTYLVNRGYFLSMIKEKLSEEGRDD